MQLLILTVNKFENVDAFKPVFLFHKTFQNDIRNFIPHGTATFDDRDRPWITNRITKLINYKKFAFKGFMKKKGSVNNIGKLEKFISLQNKLSSLNETLSSKNIS